MELTGNLQKFQIPFNSEQCQCQEHQKKLEIVCLQQNCDSKGMICTECLNTHYCHQMMSLPKYLRELNKQAEKVVQDSNFIQKQKKGCLQEAKRRINILREKINKIFDQIELDRTRESNDMQSMMKIQLAPLKGCLHLTQNSQKMTTQQYNNLFITSLQHLSKDNQPDSPLNLDEKYKEILQSQIQYNVKLKQSIENQNHTDMIWLQQRTQNFMNDLTQYHDVENSFQISPSPFKND